jgi:hypothetical protein
MNALVPLVSLVSQTHAARNPRHQRLLLHLSSLRLSVTPIGDEVLAVGDAGVIH